MIGLGAAPCRDIAGKLPTASRVRTRTVCSDRARRTRSSTTRTPRPRVPQPAWTRRRRRRHIGNVPSPGNVPATANVPGGAFTTHTASRSASALTMIRAGLDMWYECESEGGAATVAALEKMSALTAHDDKLGAAVSAAEAELKISLFAAASNDPMLDSQPHYDVANLFGAWNHTTGSPDVVVQVLDTGIDTDHGTSSRTSGWSGRDLAAVSTTTAMATSTTATATTTPTIRATIYWAATGAAALRGTIAADTNNGIGVAGVAGGNGSPDSGARLMISLGFGDSNTGGFAEALVYGADNGAQISSNSWGYTAPDVYEQAVLDAIDYYNDMGGIVVFAAGNSNSEACYYPGCYDGVVGVAALDNGGTRASFSNYGEWIDISAPGVDVMSTMTDEGYGTASGTSMACPHVAGILALGKSANPNASQAELLHCLYDTAADIASENTPAMEGKLGKGLVDAEAFVDCCVEGAPTAAPTITKCRRPPRLHETDDVHGPDREPFKLHIEIQTDNYPQNDLDPGIDRGRRGRVRLARREGGRPLQLGRAVYPAGGRAAPGRVHLPVGDLRRLGRRQLLRLRRGLVQASD